MAMKDVSVVLAHGALKKESVEVSAAPLPLTSLADDVAALNRSLDRTEGPIVLAAHAYAGAVIALASPERVRALVYVTALAPDEGEKVADDADAQPYGVNAGAKSTVPGDGGPTHAVQECQC
jgi:pimeloyl-ACP methyl ester carboxylesterase